MRIQDILSEQQLDELSFMGSQCTKDCSGHRAGYNWSVARGGIENPASHSQSFVNGSNIGHRQVSANKQQRTQGGGRIKNYQSQTANAQRKRQARAQAKVNQGMQGSPMDETRIIHPSRVDVFFSPDPNSRERRVVAKNIPSRVVDMLIAKVSQKFGVRPHDFFTVPVGDDAYTITENNMRISEFAPTPNFNPGGDGQGMPWHQFAREIMKWMKGQGFSAHPVGDNAIQFSKQHGDADQFDDEDPYAEDVWLQAIIENNTDGTFNYMMGSITNGEMDTPLEDYQGQARMNAQGLNHFILLAQEAFGL